MTRNELFRVVGPDRIARVISFDSIAEKFYFHLNGGIEPTASYGLSAKDVGEMMTALERTHFGAEILPARMLRALQEKLAEFIKKEPWKDLREFRDAIQEFDELQKETIPVRA